MLRILASLIFLAFISCTGDSPDLNGGSTPVTEGSTGTDKVQVKDDSYDVSLEIDEAQEGVYELLAAIELRDDSYIVSPFSRDTIFGPFEISFEHENNLIIGEELRETPMAIEEFDEVVGMPVAFVRQNTTYSLDLRTRSEEAFEAHGTIWFVLEPSCVPQEVKFKLTYKDGEMKVERTSIGTAEDAC